ncbi:uncharacterized protein BP5553_04090 [Venustampulla echinocandica]|uniref:Uncharacterized protein n=1 Tax=Venustampulla echinocandica TaxID=2656787 RepID=A0A370TW44_9HELO|nr:uncharacterized protein BP5553_04090 [Venustampulla echinocandica]RDL39750.1 hypothetical protein BP5553_04090 [Venustampulla echinocandica]
MRVRYPAGSADLVVEREVDGLHRCKTSGAFLDGRVGPSRGLRTMCERAYVRSDLLGIMYQTDISQREADVNSGTGKIPPGVGPASWQGLRVLESWTLGFYPERSS